MDETTVSLHPPLRACWMKRGQQKRIPAAGQQKTHHVFAAYNWRTDQVIWTTAAKKNSETFIEFLEHFVQSRSSDRPAILILDNASYHWSKATQAALSLFEDQLLPLWLPAYCSDLNPIERFWKHLKEYACANKLFPSIEQLVQAVQNCLLIQTHLDHPDRFSFSKDF